MMIISRHHFARTVQSDTRALSTFAGRSKMHLAITVYWLVTFFQGFLCWWQRVGKHLLALLNIQIYARANQQQTILALLVTAG